MEKRLKGKVLCWKCLKMAFNSIIRIGVPLFSSALYISQKAPIMNETKRNFYEDEENVTPVPGTVIAATDAEIEALGPNKLINGSSIRSPEVIQSQLSSARGTVNQWISTTGETVDSLTTKFHAKEHHFFETISNLHYRPEELLPASLYILVAGLSGTILTRRSNLFFKGVTPVIFGLIAFKFTLPKTFQNTTGFLHKIEHNVAPLVADKQDTLVKDVGHFIEKTEAKSKEASQTVESWNNRALNTFKSFTGLKINDEVTKK